MASSDGESDAEQVERPGLRERKKALTRRAISDVATELFVARGFDEVTLAEVADAAGVSVKTIFNYFSSKEELFFDREDELLAGLLATIGQRPAGTTVAAALGSLLSDNLVPFPGTGWGRLRDPEQYKRFRTFVAAQQASAALRARRLAIALSWMEPLAGAVAEELGLERDDPGAEVYASMLVAAIDLRHRVLAAAVLDRTPARTVERRVRATVAEALGRLERAFADLDPPA